MIIIKSDPEVDLMRQAGRITAGARTVARQMVEPGVTTRQINREVHKFITKSGASPCFMTDGGFPTAACISVNDEIIHGIPGDRVLHEGDIVSVDVGARYRGFNGDCAGTFPCGKCSDEALRLIRITRQSFFEGIQFARVGYRISDIGHAVQEYAESYGYSLVREYVGHGVGASLHEAPEIPTTREAGVDLLVANWCGILAHPGTPAATQSALTELSRRIVADPEFAQQTTRAAGEPPTFVDGDGFGRQIASEIAEYRDVIAAMRRI